MTLSRLQELERLIVDLQQRHTALVKASNLKLPVDNSSGGGYCSDSSRHDNSNTSSSTT